MIFNLERIRKSKLTKAICLLMVFMMSFPVNLLALTGGPTQPEFQKFQVAGNGDFVDLFSGDLKYSLPLFDVGGYPVTLAYSGNISPEADAGWVGLGWSLNTGAITRGLRGIPDDFKGDVIKTTIRTKPRRIYKTTPQIHKKDGKTFELFGLTGKKKNRKANLFKNFTIIYDNYKGLGLDYDMSLMSFPRKTLSSDIAEAQKKIVGGSSENIKKEGVKSLKEVRSEKTSGLSFNLNYNSFNGNSYKIRPGIGNINKTKSKIFKSLFSMAANTSIGFNSQGGLTSMGYGTGMPTSKSQYGRSVSLGYSHYFMNNGNVPDITPNKINRSHSYFLSFAKGALFNSKRKISANLQYSVSKYRKNNIEKQSYGYFYMDEKIGNHQRNKYVLDFQQQTKILDDYTKLLPSATKTYDVFNIAANGVGGSFRAHHNSVGILGPPSEKNTASSSLKINLELGKGAAEFELGADLGVNINTERKQIWKKNNNLWDKLSFAGENADDNFQKFTLRNQFEFIETQPSFTAKYGNEIAVKASLKKPSSSRGYLSPRVATNILYDVNKVTTVTGEIKKEKRDAKQQVIHYLNAITAHKYGLYKDIENYTLLSEDFSLVGDALIPLKLPRISNNKKIHHLSEIQVLQPNGSRYFFSTPVYNTVQEDRNFSIETKGNDVDYLHGLIKYTGTENGISNKKGREELFYKKTTPAYAHSFLLNAVLSPDYVDKEGDGPSPDDIGNYTKFNYGSDMQSGSNEHVKEFKWRTPYKEDYANHNRGYKSDPNDDKASFTYGEREEWYIQSLESKEKIAFFYLGKRKDGYGVKGVNGGLDLNGVRKKFLQKIVIYTRANFVESGFNATPIQEIKFHYSYDLCGNVLSNNGFTGNWLHPLNSFDGNKYGHSLNAKKGKLTLHKVEFKYGKLGMHTSAPYIFEYNNHNPNYAYKATDRWGTYRDILYMSGNSINGADRITSADYPYATQDQSLANSWSSAYMLSDITLPSGGKIHFEFESDDYAYVQDKKAMQMINIESISKSSLGNNKDYKFHVKGKSELSKYINFERKSGTTYKDYLPDDDGLIYYNFCVAMAPTFKSVEKYWEHISGFLEFETRGDYMDNGKHMTFVRVKTHDVGRSFNLGLGGFSLGTVKPIIPKEVHPITKMALQYGLQNTPSHYNPGGNLKETGYKNIAKMSIGFIPNFIKMITGETRYLINKGHGVEIDKDRSYLRLNVASSKKLGGGCRVKSVTINDNWDNMTNNDELKSEYIIKYDYTKIEEGKEISSGIASYEPMVGGDENPWKMPLYYDAYKQAFNKAITKPHPITISYDLGPIGEEYFPSPSVGYSKVTVTNTNTDAAVANISRHKTGKTITEFYTAKDFPTYSEATTLDMKTRNFKSPSLSFKPEKGEDENEKKIKPTKLSIGLDVSINLSFTAASQGIKVVKNDMHGKIKSTATYAEGSKTPLSKTEYFYKRRGNKLLNSVTVLRKDGTYEEVKAGIDIESTIYAVRAVKTGNNAAIGVNLDFGSPLPIVGNALPAYHFTKDDTRMMVFTKIINKVGILDKVVVTNKGASTNTHNLAWDALTGKVLLTSVKNEFDQTIYSLSKPAHWMYPGMAGAYNSVGMTVTLTIGADGIATDNSNLLFPGDELVLTAGLTNTTSTEKVWVLDAGVVNNVKKVSLIDKNGVKALSGSIRFYLLNRSGHRNILGASVEQITLRTNPLRIENGNKVFKAPYSEVIQASAATFDDKRMLLYKEEICFEKACPSASIIAPLTGKLSTFGYLLRTGYDNALLNPPHDIIKHDEQGFPYGKPNFNGSCCSGNVGSSPPASSPPPLSPCFFSCGSMLNCDHYEINPYTWALRGVWRPADQYVYFDRRNTSAERTQLELIPNNSNSTKRVDAGFLTDFQEFWEYSTNQWVPKTIQGPNNPWVWKTKVNKIDFYGNALESVDALGIKNSVLYDYNRRLPVAVVSNAKYTNVMFDGFEDYSINSKIKIICMTGDSLPTADETLDWTKDFCEKYRHWPLGKALIGGANAISEKEAHTGRKSLLIATGNTDIPLSYVNQDCGIAPPSPTIPLNSFNTDKYKDYAGWFSPEENKEYVISLWVKETKKGQFNLEMLENNNSLVLTPVINKQVIIDGWRKIDYKFTIPINTTSDKIIIRFNNNVTETDIENCYIDDIRVHPVDANMESYVYDWTNARLMSKLDANNYALFYEYDLEGNLIRQKVETKDGIKTLSESRSSLKK